MTLMLISLLSLAACAAPPTAAPPPPASTAAGFWDHWGDGRAELSGYRIRQPRYGTGRPGHAVLVFVTERFTDKTRVKSDGGHKDEFPVIKLNETRDFQTGIYDYNVMTSTFQALDGRDRPGVPTKIAFSAQEWCGHVYDQLLVTDDHYDRTSHSYFDGEADQSGTMAIPTNGLFADALPLAVRGLSGPVPERGDSRTIALHPRLMDLRLTHRDASWTSAIWSVAPEAGSTTVPAGTFPTLEHTLTAGVSTWTWAVEVAAPHRIIAWTGPEGESGELTGSIREPYWAMSGPEGMKRLEDLGLGLPSWTQP